MVANKPRLSREYVWLPLDQLNIDLSDMLVKRAAFLTDAEAEPDDADWRNAIVVPDEEHPLWNQFVGKPSLVILVGPARGDAVTTEDLGLNDYQVWLEGQATGSDERVVRRAGVLTISLAGGA